MAKPAPKKENSKKKGKQRVESDADEPVRGKKAGQLTYIYLAVDSLGPSRTSGKNIWDRRCPCCCLASGSIKYM